MLAFGSARNTSWRTILIYGAEPDNASRIRGLRGLKLSLVTPGAQPGHDWKGLVMQALSSTAFPTPTKPSSSFPDPAKPSSALPAPTKPPAALAARAQPGPRSAEGWLGKPCAG